MLDERGFEIPDQTPVAVPAFIKKYDERDRIKDLIRQALSQEAEDAGFESWEEADDFDVGDDYDPTSPYEECFDPETGISQWETPYRDVEAEPGNDTETVQQSAPQGHTDPGTDTGEA